MKMIIKQNLLALLALFFVTQISIADEMSAPASSAQKKMTKEKMSKENMMQENTMQENAGAANMPESSQSSMMESSTEVTTGATMGETETMEMAGFSRGTVARSVFTTLIDNREPIDKVQKVPEKQSDIIYFTELRDMSGQVAKHRWEFKGKIISEVKFTVRGPRWRVWSKKTFVPGWSGDWKVSVINGVGEVISEEVIAYAEPIMEMMKADGAAESTEMNSDLDTNKLAPMENVTAQ